MICVTPRGGNATVPDGVPATPKQGFASLASKFFKEVISGGITSNCLDWRGFGLTSVDSELIYVLAHALNDLGQAITFDLRNNPLTVANADALMGVLGGLGVNGDFYLSTQPTPAALHADGFVDITLSPGATSGLIMSFTLNNGNGNTYTLTENNSLALADSVLGAIDCVLGTSDAPTAAQKAAKALALIQSMDFIDDALATNPTATTLRVRIVQEADLPISSGAGITEGSPVVPNADMTNAIGHGWNIVVE